MTDDAGHRMGATRAPAHSANISGSTFGDNIRINQGFLNIFFSSRTTVSRESTPSPAVQAQLEEKERMDCRRSLSFRDLDARLQNIFPVQQGTCEWIFHMPVFQNWYEHAQHDNGLLWIKGNPGTGKSTLMKHILEYCQTKRKYTIAAYFFNARGTKLEQTPLGMLRSLLFQLLSHEPRLYDQLLPIYRQKQQDHSSGDWEWREPELKSFFLSEIPKCQPGPLLFIIDALDECSEYDVQNVAEFLQLLIKNATDAGLLLNICLSSRHFPSIRCAKYQELVLEKEKKHDEDIIKYISSNLTKKDQEVEEAIRKRSSGIFMWVVLVIRLLNRAYEDGRVEAMKDMLDEIPNELEEMFAMLLDRDNPDKDETILILQCVLLAKRPFTPEELFFAIVAGTNSKALGEWNPLQVTGDIIRRRIISSSRGLIEIRKRQNDTSRLIYRSGRGFRRVKIRKIYRDEALYETEEDEELYETEEDAKLAGTQEGERKTVQFIHGSVNDFLLRNRRLQKLDPRLSPDPIAKSHDRLKDCCMAYLMMESLELQNVEETKSRFPFLKYASRYLFAHAEEATSVGQSELLRTLEYDTVFKRIEHFHKFFVNYGQRRMPLNLLQILAASGLPKLVVSLLDRGADINAEGVPCGTALQAAIEFEREGIVKTLLSKGAKIDPHGKPRGHTTLYRAFKKGNGRILAMLIDKGATLDIFERISKGSVLHHAVETGNEDIIAMVLDKGAKVNALGLVGNVLCVAAKEGSEDIVQMLLERGAKIDTRGLFGSALTCAASEGNIEVVQLLLEKGANIDTRGVFGSALTCAAAEGHIEVVQLLLERGAKIDTRGVLGSPLACAALETHMEVMGLLLDEGPNIHVRGLFGSPLECAAVGGHAKMVNVLLNKGARVNDWGGIFGSALHGAAMKGNTDVVEMLLEKGANINARGLIGPGYLLTDGSDDVGKTKIQEMLLAKGIKMGTWGKIYGTVLQAAASKGHEHIVQLLLDRGAKR